MIAFEAKIAKNHKNFTGSMSPKTLKQSCNYTDFQICLLILSALGAFTQMTTWRHANCQQNSSNATIWIKKFQQFLKCSITTLIMDSNFLYLQKIFLQFSLRLLTCKNKCTVLLSFFSWFVPKTTMETKQNREGWISFALEDMTINFQATLVYIFWNYF